MTASLRRLTLAIADALQAGDLDAAECLVAERGRLLDGAGSRAGATPAPGTASIVAVSERDARAILDADGRSVAALTDAMAATHRELRALAVGAQAMRGYLAEAPMAPGYVDSRD
ncbi:MAG: hypothetical protein HY216_12880 [Candidatus Rokubacteria bacterium]|nr:hypothetical protein [Candidatus Rokubacteria bacterium]